METIRNTATKISQLETQNTSSAVLCIYNFQLRVSLCSLQIIALKLMCSFRYCYKICSCWKTIGVKKHSAQISVSFCQCSMFIARFQTLLKSVTDPCMKEATGFQVTLSFTRGPTFSYPRNCKAASAALLDDSTLINSPKARMIKELPRAWSSMMWSFPIIIQGGQ